MALRLASSGTANINLMQFRAEKEVEMPKPIDTYRIFLTGGSTAFGSGAPSQESTIAGYLEIILSERLSPSSKLKYEVFTMANPAWASTHERIIIENRLSEMAPDMIISFSGCNDLLWGMMGRNILWFRSYYDEHFLRLIKTVYNITHQPDIPEITQIETSPVLPSLVCKRLLKNVKLSSFILSDEGINYFFVLQPILAVTGKKLTKREQESLNHQDYCQQCYALIDMALKNFQGKTFQYANLSDIFDNMSDQEDIFLDSFHFGDKGNEIIAENIFLNLKDSLSK